MYGDKSLNWTIAAIAILLIAAAIMYFSTTSPSGEPLDINDSGPATSGARSYNMVEINGMKCLEVISRYNDQYGITCDWTGLNK